MTNEDLFLGKEILLKEEEKHQLVLIGAIKDLSKTISETLSFYQSKTFDKTKLLDFFYREVIQYQKYIDQQKESNKLFKNKIHRVSEFYLKKKRDGKKALLDKELKSNVSIGWFYPIEVFNDFYHYFCLSKAIFDSPISVNSFFKRQIDELYPLDVNRYVSLLKEEKSSFWEITCQYIKELINIVAQHVLFSPQRAELIKDSAWSDTYEILRSKLKEKELLTFNSGTDFRNYIISICHFRLQNRRKDYEMKEESFENLLDLDVEEQDDREREISSQSIIDIDIDNSYEVAYAIAIILLNPKHPFYQSLTKGIEDRVDVLLRRVLKGQCYNTIVEEKYGIHPNSEGFVKTVTKMRKEYERVRKTLQERFISIKKDIEKCHN